MGQTEPRQLGLVDPVSADVKPVSSTRVDYNMIEPKSVFCEEHVSPKLWEIVQRQRTGG